MSHATLVAGTGAISNVGRVGGEIGSHMFSDAQMLPTLPAADLDRAKAWYADKLGLNPIEEEEMAGAWYESGGSRFLIYPSSFAGTNKATAATMAVDDFDGAIAALRAAGATFQDFEFGEFKTVDGVIQLPDGRKGAWVYDSEDNILNILSAH